MSAVVYLVDLATGVCTPGARPDLLLSRAGFTPVRLPDGRIVCAGGCFPDSYSLGEVYGPPELGAPDAAWAWRQLPALIVPRNGCHGCVMSDGRFAVFGGMSDGGVDTPSCEVLVTGDNDEHWESLPPMHDYRFKFACEAVAGCIIVAGGLGRQSAEVYDEVLGRWLRLPHDLPSAMGSVPWALRLCRRPENFFRTTPRACSGEYIRTKIRRRVDDHDDNNSPLVVGGCFRQQTHTFNHPRSSAE